VRDARQRARHAVGIHHLGHEASSPRAPAARLSVENTSAGNTARGGRRAEARKEAMNIGLFATSQGRLKESADRITSGSGDDRQFVARLHHVRLHARFDGSRQRAEYSLFL
jgi:hypothetical protein